LFSTLTEALKSRILQELRGFWATDPNYRDSLVGNIQGRYSFLERPQQAIILKNQSASPLQLSADHYQGIVVSYCHLTKVAGQPGKALEWVREDGRAIAANNGVFPSSAGIYYIEIRKEQHTLQGIFGEYFVFYVDPLLEVIDETPMQLEPRLFEVSAAKFHPGSLRVYEMPGNLVLYEGINYTADATIGRITLARPLPPGTTLSVDYRYPGTTTGPFVAPENGSANEAIPGVVLAFGRNFQEGDIMAVVVTSIREDAAKEYGGRWEMSMDLDIMARDITSQGEITDRTLTYLWTVARTKLSCEGIEITQVSMGGEAEEIYDETGDDYFYTASLSISLTTDWAIHVPLDRAIMRIIPHSVEASQAVAGLDDDQLVEAGSPTNLQIVPNLGLMAVSDPWFRDRNRNFEIIR